MTDRLAVTAGVPFVFAKYTGGLPPPSGLPVDSLSMLALRVPGFRESTARYRFGEPHVGGDAGVALSTSQPPLRVPGGGGRSAKIFSEFAGVNTAVRLRGPLRKAAVQGSYVYCTRREAD